MHNFIPLASPDIRIEDVDAVKEVLLSGNLVQGKKVEALEDEIANFLGVPHCVAVTNGTATLHLILEALGIGIGDEVIVPAFSYIATANVVELVKAKPVFVDIEISSFNLNINNVVEKISNKTKAIIVVHEFGLTADLTQLKNLCDHHGILLIEDAACALGAKENDSFAGTIGYAGSFSFHPRKAVTSGEGGAIVTHDKDFANKLRALRNHGIDPENKSKMTFVLAGYNCRMTDFQAALLLSQLKRLTKTLFIKQSIASRYLKEIVNSNLLLPTVPVNKVHSWQTFHIVLQNGLSQSLVIEKLRDMGIGANYGAQCIPAQSFFQIKYGHKSDLEFPNAFLSFTKGLAVPLYEKLNNTQVTHIINSLNKL